MIEKRTKSIHVREESRSGVIAVKGWMTRKGIKWIIICIHDMVRREAANLCMNIQSPASKEYKRIGIEPKGGRFVEMPLSQSNSLHRIHTSGQSHQFLFMIPSQHNTLDRMFGFNLRSLAEAAINTITGGSQTDEEIAKLMREAEKQDCSFG